MRRPLGGATARPIPATVGIGTSITGIAIFARKRSRTRIRAPWQFFANLFAAIVHGNFPAIVGTVFGSARIIIVELIYVGLE